MTTVEQRSESWNTVLTVRPGNMDLHISNEQMTGPYLSALEVVDCYPMDQVGINMGTSAFTLLTGMATYGPFHSTKMAP